jgi:hypothetical protein
MPWRECYKMDERLRFVTRLLDGEKMAVLCREFDISRKTGYKMAHDIGARHGAQGPSRGSAAVAGRANMDSGLQPLRRREVRTRQCSGATAGPWNAARAASAGYTQLALSAAFSWPNQTAAY